MKNRNVLCFNARELAYLCLVFSGLLGSLTSQAQPALCSFPIPSWQLDCVLLSGIVLLITTTDHYLLDF